MRVIGVALLAATLVLPAAAQTRHIVHRHAHRLHRVARATGWPAWGSTVYGESLPFVNGTCIDPYDPDPIGGPESVGEGGPGGYGPQCRRQAGVILGTTVQ